MTEKRIIPMTSIWSRYQKLRKLPQEGRLAEAQDMVSHPEVLATEFAESVMHFASYTNLEDPFYPRRAKRAFAEGIKRTNDLVLRLEKQTRLVPTDAPNRRTEQDAGTTVTAVPASRLACDYVDRELLVQRTTSPAQWADERRNVGGLRLDVLLADSADRTPIVGELKLPGDMDPFFALVQALACAAHLATSQQYDRMRRHLESGKFTELNAAPRLDVWLLFVHAPPDQPGRSLKGRIGSIRLLRWWDVDWEKNSIRWRGENDKIGFEHVTPLTLTGKEALSRARKVQGAIGDSWVFPAPENPSLAVSRHLVRDWWERGEKLAEIHHEPGLGWHSLRRKFATELKHTPLKDLCYLGGWKEPQTVLKCYQRPDESTMREALEGRKPLKALGG